MKTAKARETQHTDDGRRGADGCFLHYRPADWSAEKVDTIWKLEQPETVSNLLPLSIPSLPPSLPSCLPPFLFYPFAHPHPLLATHSMSFFTFNKAPEIWQRKRAAAHCPSATGARLGAFNPAAECNLEQLFPLSFIISMKSTNKDWWLALKQ